VFDIDCPSTPLINLRIVTCSKPSKQEVSQRNVTVFDSTFCRIGLISKRDWSLVSLAEVVDYLRA
jgi:hypothetical protein